jgi:hypothetical protein
MTAIRTLMTDMESGAIELPTKDFFPHLYNELSCLLTNIVLMVKFIFTPKWNER